MEAVEVLAVLEMGLASAGFPAVVGCMDEGVVGIYRETEVLAGPLGCTADGGGGSTVVPGEAGEKGGTTVLWPPTFSLLFLGTDGLNITEVVVGRCPENPGVKGRADLLKMPEGELWVPPPPKMPDGDWS